jgi:hypothetical protein
MFAWPMSPVTAASSVPARTIRNDASDRRKGAAVVGGSARLAVGLFEPEREGHPVPSFPWNRTGLGQAMRDPG